MNRDCQRSTGNGRYCGLFETLEHRLVLCPVVQTCSEAVLRVVEWIVGRDVDRKELLYLNISIRWKSTLTLGLWFLVKLLFCMFNGRMVDIRSVFGVIVSEIDWNLENDIVIGSREEMRNLRNHIISSGIS